MSTSSKTGITNKMPAQFTFSLETPSLSSGTLDKYLKSVLGSDSSSAIPDLLKPADTASSSSASGTASSTPAPHPVAPEATKDAQNGSHTPSPSFTTPSVGPAPVAAPPGSASVSVVSAVPSHLQAQANGDGPSPSYTITTSNNKDFTTPSSTNANDNSHHMGNGTLMPPSTSTQLTTTTPADSSTDIIPVPRGQSYVDITEYLNMPQSEAAKKLGIPPSTLSKRWKEAVRKRKWPYRMICKIDKEIMTLLHNVPQGPNAPPLPEEIETALGQLLRKRQEELRPVVIRI